MTETRRTDLKRRIVDCLSPAQEVRKIVVFGSFLTAANPHDIDVAIFLDRNDTYPPLALKYRRMTRQVSLEIPLDIIPVRPDASGSFFDEINQGEVIYERNTN